MSELASITHIHTKRKTAPLPPFLVQMGKHRIAALRAQYPFLEPVEKAPRTIPPPCTERSHIYCRCNGPRLAPEQRPACPCEECVRRTGDDQQ